MVSTLRTLPPDQVFYSKTSNIRKKLNLDRKKIGLRKFEDIIAQFSEEPEDATEPFIVTYLVEEDNTGKLRYSVMFVSKHLIQTYMKPGKNWLEENWNQIQLKLKSSLAAYTIVSSKTWTGEPERKKIDIFLNCL